MASQFSQTRRSLINDTSRVSNFVWLFTGTLLAFWMIWFFAGSVTVYEISRQARLEVRQASHHVSTVIASKVVSSHIAIGKSVEAGDILMELDASSERSRLAEEQARLEGIEPKMASLRAEIEARRKAREDDLGSANAASEVARFRNDEAGAALEFARENERRLTRLNSLGTTTLVDANRAANDVLKLAAARQAMMAEIKRSELEAQSHAHQNDALIESLRRSLVTLEGDISTTRATIERLKIDIERHIVRAPIAGRMGDVLPIHAGAYVAEGQRLATVVPEGDLVIVADFSPSLALGRVRAGQSSRLRLDGFPWAQYGTVPATVSRVASEVRDNLVRVELTIDGDAAHYGVVQHGLPGSVEVSIEQVSPASLMLRAAGLLLSRPVRTASAP